MKKLKGINMCLELDRQALKGKSWEKVLENLEFCYKAYWKDLERGVKQAWEEINENKS